MGGGCELTRSHPDRVSLAFGHDDERHLDLDITTLDRSEGVDDKLRRDVPGADVDDPYDGFAAAHCQRAEVGVVRDDHPTLCASATKDRDIVSATKTEVDDGYDVTTPSSQRSDDVGVDVLIRQERPSERVHAGIFRSHIACSRTACEAKSRAAWKPSTVTWG